MKKIILTVVALFSINFLFAFENKKEFLLIKINTPLDSEMKVLEKQDQKNSAFRKGAIVISAGYGFGNFTKTLFMPYYDFDAFTYSASGPIHFKGEYGLSDKIGIGLSINYISGNAFWNDTYVPSTGQLTNPAGRWDFSLWSILLRMNLHFAPKKKLDPYVGIGAGYRQENWRFLSPYPLLSPAPPSLYSPTYLPWGFETTVGLRYCFTNNIGIYTEIGFAKAIIQGGITVKFK